MPILTEQQIVHSLHLEKYQVIAMPLISSMMNVLKINQLNGLYDRYAHLENIAFIDAILSDLKINIEISKRDLERLPACGPYIVVANHPLGGLDGLILLKIMLEKNPNAKIMGNFLLKNIKPICHNICAVNPFERHKDKVMSTCGIREAIKNLHQGHPLGIFPSGEVSMRSHGLIGEIQDKKWDKSVMKLIKHSKVPVVPIFFNAKNSDFFYLASSLDGYLRTSQLASELLKSANKTIQVRIGNGIGLDDQDRHQDIDAYTTYIRHKTYALGQCFKQAKILHLPFVQKKTKVETVVEAMDKHDVTTEMEALLKDGKNIFEAHPYQVILTQLSSTSYILKEIGRLRELSFRAVGEGSNHCLDLDMYDDHYHHLILWHTTERTIVGAYRMTFGGEEFYKHGYHTLYTASLFKFDPLIFGQLRQTIEIGRAFISEAFQKKPLPLFLLWKGIIAVTKKYPEYKYLSGAVSISNEYCDYSKSLIVSYLKHNHFDRETAALIKPKKPFKSILNKQENQRFFINKNLNIKSLDKMIEEIEPEGLKIPILIKKYLLHHATFIGFNVDTHFNNAIDALLYIKISDIDVSTFE